MLLQITLPRLRSYSPVILSTLLYSFAILGRLPPGMGQSHPVQGRISSRGSVAAGMSVHSQAPSTPGRGGPGSRDSVPTDPTDEPPEWPSAAATWGEELQAHLLRVAPRAGPRITVNLLYSFGKLGQAPTPELMQVGGDQGGLEKHGWEA